jgi:hypothetical protein
MFLILYKKFHSIFHVWAIIFFSVWCFWDVNEIKIEFTRAPFYMNIIFLILGITVSFFYLASKNYPDNNLLNFEK